MICRYCGTRNDESEHRCVRCGRRPGDTLTPSSTPVMTGATAPRLEPVAQLHMQNLEGSTADRPAPDLSHAFQKSLFDDRKVLSFPRTPQRAPRRNAESAPRQRKPRPAPEGQGKLDLLPPAPAKPRQLGTTVDAKIYCEFPVATPSHRAVAALVDWAMVVIGFGLFLGLFLAAGGEIVVTRNTALFDAAIAGGVLAMIGFVYGGCFALAGTETFGMRAVHLRLVTFEGAVPDLRQRMLRFFGACLTRCTLLGILWCLADEEGLSWPDHISRTFPTPDDPGSVIIRRG